MNIRITEPAKNDLINGYTFYEKQDKGLGSYFLNSLFSDIDSLCVYASIHSIHFEKYHRLLSKRFPYAVYYTLHNKNVLVHAVLDCRRNPAWIKDRLE